MAVGPVGPVDDGVVDVQLGAIDHVLLGPLVFNVMPVKCLFSITSLLKTEVLRMN